MKRFPELFKKNTQGKIEHWKISVSGFPVLSPHSYKVTQEYGELGGKKISKTYYVSEGKNIGRANETTVKEQALSEAQSKWEKKLKQGYVKSAKDAQDGKTDEVIKGGIVPMTAHSFQDYKDRVTFPVYVQPKLDGQRCIAIFDGKKVTLWTRSRKQIHCVPHIEKELTAMLKLKNTGRIILDGELYAHKLRNDFEKLMSIVRKNKVHELSEEIEFHIYDIVQYENPFRVRWHLLTKMPEYFKSIQFVETTLVKTPELIKKAHEQAVKAGYEGIMIRDGEGLYECKRTKNLLKYKDFLDAEFPIIGFVNGKDDTVVAVLTNGTKTFRATMSGDKKENKKYLKGKWNGKLLTVKFFSYTGKNKVPRFPVGVRIRDEL